MLLASLLQTSRPLGHRAALCTVKRRWFGTLWFLQRMVRIGGFDRFCKINEGPETAGSPFSIVFHVYQNHQRS